MVSGTETTTGNEAGALESGESNTPPIYQALLNEMDTDTRAVVKAAGSAKPPAAATQGPVAPPAADPQHRSSVNARAGQGGSRTGGTS